MPVSKPNSPDLHRRDKTSVNACQCSVSCSRFSTSLTRFSSHSTHRERGNMVRSCFCRSEQNVSPKASRCLCVCVRERKTDRQTDRNRDTARRRELVHSVLENKTFIVTRQGKPYKLRKWWGLYHKIHFSHHYDFQFAKHFHRHEFISSSLQTPGIGLIVSQL